MRRVRDGFRVPGPVAGSIYPPPVQGVTSTTQAPPDSPAEFEDAATAIDAGVPASTAIGYEPAPIREHAAFLAGLWSNLLDSEYSSEASYLMTGAWTAMPSSVLTASNEDGHTLAVDVALSLEILPAQFGYDQETLDLLSSVSARFGVAWTTMTGSQAEANILVWWFEWTGPEGTSTAIGPLTTIEDEDIDLMRTIVPLMDGFFDDPLNYNIDGTLVFPEGIWSNFRTAIAIAVVVAVVAVLAVTVVGAIVVAGTAAASLGGAATTAAVGAAALKAGAALVGSMIVASGGVYVANALAYNQLVQDLEDQGHNLDGMTKDEILALAHSLYR